MNLFNEPVGLRLQRLEIYNWGTFHEQIYSMAPHCGSAVLTGANGAGKSTIVDALLTLLVDGRRRNYNVAASASNRRERTEATYVRGQYSRARGEEQFDAQPRTLRGSDDYSALLAVFFDAAQQRTVSLAQMLWISGSGRVEKRYYVGDCELSIEAHLHKRHIVSADLPSDVERFTSFGKYSEAFRKRLGLGGRPKALDLFNQTVAVKEIASLNEFVRDHMLDKGNPEARVDRLRAQYQELNDAHAAIQKADRQIALLAPLIEAGAKYRQYDAEMTRYEQLKQVIPLYVAEQAANLLQTEIASGEAQQVAQHAQLQQVDRELAALRAELQESELAIAQDSVGRLKQQLAAKLPPLQREIEALRRAAERYDAAAGRVGLAAYRDAAAFDVNRQQAPSLRAAALTEIEALDARRTDAQIAARDILRAIDEHEAEIAYLQRNASNIPHQVAQIRETLCAALEVEPLPFVGELLQVRSSESKWEGALERLLHSFALELIVPDVLYPRFRQAVDERHLGGRLVYRRMTDGGRRRLSGDLSADWPLAHQKVEVRPDTPYSDWLAQQLLQRFAFRCCERVDQFGDAQRAITVAGQIKHSATRFEKDDRRRVDDRTRFVLGWDNREKLQRLKRALQMLQRQRQQFEAQAAAADSLMAQQRTVANAVDALLAYEAYSELDWRSMQTEYDRLCNQLRELDDSSLRRLEAQRDRQRQLIESAMMRRDRIRAALTTIENELQRHQAAHERAVTVLATTAADLLALRQASAELLERIDRDRDPLTPDTINERVSELATSVDRSISNFRRYQAEQWSIISGAMHGFRSTFPDEGALLTVQPEALPAYERIYTRLSEDDLPRYQERFKQMLDRSVATSVQEFKAQLDERDRSIERSVEELNLSLARIDYGGGSIIRLIAEPVRDPEIAEFKRQLTACIPNFGDASTTELNRAFRALQGLIGRFNDDPGWMQRVIDVRRWRHFSAEQLAADGRQLDYYSDSSGKSGGQKAKLAYTILASAIAHQYGLHEQRADSRSFRLVVIDEAFSKLDDENARFAMQLFERLGLQLLVVTPMQQLNVIDRYVEAFHFVHINSDGNRSAIVNMTVTEYRRERQRQQR